MVFSFFKKDPKDDKKGSGSRPRSPGTGPRTGGGTEVATRPLPKPIGRPLTGPVNRAAGPTAVAKGGPPSLPEHERARNLARQAAAKIDQIEAEMARDMLGKSNRGATTVAPRTTVTVPAEPTRAAAPTATVRPAAAPDPLEENSGLHGGNIDAIEINTAGGSSAIDEAVILFANGQLDATEQALRTAMQSDDLGPAARTAWHMLFELLNYRSDRAGFDKLAMEYALRFEKSPPAWIEDTAPEPAAAGQRPAPPPTGAGVRLPATVDAGIVGHLEELRALTATHAAVQLDASDVTRIDIAGATLLLRVINAFKRSQRQLTLVGASELTAVLSKSVESGRRDASDALWMLLLEVLRMLGRSDEFEEAAIQYCVTFEVSPPQWEPPLAHLKVAPASAPTASAPEVAAGSPLVLRGTIEGEGEPHFSRLVASARSQPQVVIDCRGLRRLSYSAGSALAGTLRRIAQGGTTVELRDVGALVGTLLHLLGIEAVAKVRSRYA